MRVSKIERLDLGAMSEEELWSLHELVTSILARKLSADKARLDQRLRRLKLGTLQANIRRMTQASRPYPPVFPKFRNPAEPAETWSGRGKQPRWLTAQLRSGKKLDDFRIQPSLPDHKLHILRQ
jgi:DNA-binding protein H-NS